MTALEGARKLQRGQQKPGSEGEIRQQVPLKPHTACVCQRERERGVWPGVPECVCVCVCD